MSEIIRQLGIIIATLQLLLAQVVPVNFGAVSEPCSTEPMVYNSTEYRIFRYLAKLEENKGTAYWDNPHVQRVLTNGEPDVAKVKSLFIERGIGGGFDEAVSNLRSRGDVNNFSIKSDCVLKYKSIESIEFQKRTVISNTATTTP